MIPRTFYAASPWFEQFMCELLSPPGRGMTRGDTDGKTSRTVPVRSSFLNGDR